MTIVLIFKWLFQIIINSIKSSPANSKTIFLFGNKGRSFVATNCGLKINMFKHEEEFHDFKLNRMDEKYLMALKFTQCSPIDSECEEDERSLYYTSD